MECHRSRIRHLEDELKEAVIFMCIYISIICTLFIYIYIYIYTWSATGQEFATQKTISNQRWIIYLDLYECWPLSLSVRVRLGLTRITRHMYIYIYIYMHACSYIYIYVYIEIQIYVGKYAYIFTRYKYLHELIYTHIYICIYIFVYIHAFVHIFIWIGSRYAHLMLTFVHFLLSTGHSFVSFRVLCCCGVYLAVSCCVSLLFCVCLCDLFLFSQMTRAEAVSLLCCVVLFLFCVSGSGFS